MPCTGYSHIFTPTGVNVDTFSLTLQWRAMTIVITQCDAQKTEGQLKSLPRTCKLRHIPVQPTADIQWYDIGSCLR